MSGLFIMLPFLKIVHSGFGASVGWCDGFSDDSSRYDFEHLHKVQNHHRQGSGTRNHILKTSRTVLSRYYPVPGFSIHRYQDALLFEILGPDSTGILAALVAVDDFRFPMRGNGLLQYIFTPRCTHGVADTPTYDLTAININNRCHVHKPSRHWNVSNIGTPDLVGASNLQSLE